MSPKLVLTGFGHFPGVPDNPTQRLLAHLAQNPQLLPQPHRLALLDVAYQSAHAEVDGLLDPAPDALVLTGYSAKAKALTLEARATSYCAPDQPDICDFIPAQLAEPAPPITTNAPLAALSIRLKEAGIAVETSQDAGAYLCNYSYHHALSRVEERGLATKVLFVHLPALESTDLAHSAAGTISEDDAVRALALIAQELVG